MSRLRTLGKIKLITSGFAIGSATVILWYMYKGVPSLAIPAAVQCCIAIGAVIGINQVQVYLKKNRKTAD